MSVPLPEIVVKKDFLRCIRLFIINYVLQTINLKGEKS